MHVFTFSNMIITHSCPEMIHFQYFNWGVNIEVNTDGNLSGHPYLCTVQIILPVKSAGVHFLNCPIYGTSPGC